MVFEQWPVGMMLTGQSSESGCQHRGSSMPPEDRSEWDPLDGRDTEGLQFEKDQTDQQLHPMHQAVRTAG